MTNMINENWTETKTALMEGLDGRKENTPMDAVLRIQRNTWLRRRQLVPQVLVT